MIPLHDRYAKPALKLVAEDGFAPPTRCSSGSRSTPELLGLKNVSERSGPYINGVTRKVPRLC